MTGEQAALILAAIVWLILLGVVVDDVRRIRKAVERRDRP